MSDASADLHVVIIFRRQQRTEHVHGIGQHITIGCAVRVPVKAAALGIRCFPGDPSQGQCF